MSTGIGQDELDIDALESEDEDLRVQDQFKGVNLSTIAITKKGDMTKAQRNIWLNQDENENKVAMALKM